jgi:hypothetical protein
VPTDLLALPTTAFPTPLPKQKKSIYDSSPVSGSAETAPYTPFQFPAHNATSSGQMTSIGESEILYGTNDSKDVNVVEDLKRPWWRPAPRDPVNKPRSDLANERIARREKKKERAIQEGRPQLLMRKKLRVKRRSRKSSLGRVKVA